MSFRNFSRETIDAFVALTGQESGCPPLSVEIRQLGGAMDREPATPNAVASRGIPYLLIAFGVGELEEEEIMRYYLDKLILRVKPWSASRPLVNFIPPDEAITAEQLRAVYGPKRYDRLTRIKKKYDPLNVFRMNHNIRPASSSDGMSVDNT